MKCNHCGAPLVCQACGSVVEALPAEPVDLAAFVNGVLPPMESLPTTE